MASQLVNVDVRAHGLGGKTPHARHVYALECTWHCSAAAGMWRGGTPMPTRRGCESAGEGARAPAGIAGVEQACWMLGSFNVMGQCDGLCGADSLSVTPTVCHADNL